MTLIELEKLEALHAAATPGRWSPYVWQGNDDTGGWAAVGPHQESTECVCEGDTHRTACAGEFCADDRSQNDEEQAWEDAKAIAALHNAFPAMAKALREAQAEVERLRSKPRNERREAGCQYQWEAGDSACPVHGEESK